MPETNQPFIPEYITVHLGAPDANAPNITLLPHAGGAPSRENMTRAIIDALTLLEKGETTSLTVTHQQFTLMTHETLS